MKPSSPDERGLTFDLPAAAVAEAELAAVADADPDADPEPVWVVLLEAELEAEAEVTGKEETEVETAGAVLELGPGVNGLRLPRGIPVGIPDVTPVSPTVGRAALGSTVQPPEVNEGQGGAVVFTVAA